MYVFYDIARQKTQTIKVQPKNRLSKNMFLKFLLLLLQANSVGKKYIPKAISVSIASGIMTNSASSNKIILSPYCCFCIIRIHL